MYGYRRKVDSDFNKAVERTKEELKKEGFGILTEIDVKETLKKKINVEFEDYVILGACNPPLAHKALSVEQEIGLMLPCNVIVYRKEGKIFASAILPAVAMKMIENNDLKEIANQVESKLKNVINNI